MDLLKKVKKPDKPLPVEAVSVTRTMDLMVDPSLTIGNGMPVHLKTPFGSFDSEFTYKEGHLLMSRKLELNGAAITPAEWEPFIDFMRSAQTEIARGFDLERNRITNFSGLSPVYRLMEEGRTAFQAKDYAAAKRFYEEATTIDAKSKVAWNELGRAYAALREYDKAETAYKRQIELNPQDKYSYNNLGLVYRATRREDEAIACFRKQIELNPRDPYAHSNLAFALAARKDWEGAAREAAIATEITPEDNLKWFQLGQAQLKLGRCAEGLKTFEHALTLVHNAWLEKSIAYTMADAGVELDKAWQLASGALEPQAGTICEPATLSKDDKCAPQLMPVATMLDTAGWVLYRQGKSGEAEPYLESAYAIAPRVTAGLHVAVVLAKLGRTEQGLKYFAEVHTRPDFARFDENEAHKELVKALGGEEQLDARWKQIAAPPPAVSSRARVLALVDADGKVSDAKPAYNTTPDAVTQAAKSLRLAPISWPGHALRSTRMILFRHDGGKWSVYESYVAAPEIAAAAEPN